ncbi:phosphatase PAP2 family protein [Variovorax sp. N23]|uniref:phosphatase PAP2 family protein n=1 Tax=Variovorax sp. N23 TaxID=2980555 RepID=UPI0021C8B800|nr:phosphatase PAP2 family protein [Variovorax sp. N23]MCU4119460.1 phosphatase PAP2 family protein [Variovorax sp. N23]
MTRRYPTAFSRLSLFTFTALLLILLWDLAGLDLPMARLAGGSSGFALSDDAALVLWLHEVPRLLSWGCVAVLFAAVRWPFAILRGLSRRERLQLALTVIASVIAVSLLKTSSRTSCPWDLAEFGGTARYVSHWAWGVHDGGPGRCFPAGHASAAFAYLGGWFVWRRSMPRAAWVWLATAALLGLVLGLAQQWRGAHYMSHTLWTAWVCWAAGWAVDGAFHRQRPAADLRATPKLNES